MLRGWLNRLLGDRGERTAARHLRSLGCRIVARNYRNRVGEIDLIALDGETLVFVEVKTRRSLATGSPTEAVNQTKQAQIVRTASAYLTERRLQQQRVRFDIVAVLWLNDSQAATITHYRNAFNATDAGLTDA